MSRLSFLTENEQHEFEHPPLLSVELKAMCFALNDEVAKKINQLRTPTNKVGFLLQYAYFKACKRFFLIDRFTQENVKYAAKILNLSLSKIKLHKYKGKIPNYHKAIILTLFNYKSFSEHRAWVEQEISAKVARILDPKTLFLEILHQIHNHNIEIPSYNTLAELITELYLSHEKAMLKIVEEQITTKQETSLGSLLTVTKNNVGGILSQYKSINQSTQPKAIQSNIKVFNNIQKHINILLPLIDSLSLSPQSCEYYATWVKKAKLSQLKQFTDKRKLYLRLIAFLQHQYYIRQDIFVDLYLRAVQSAKNSVTRQLNKSDHISRAQQRTAVTHLNQSHKNYRALIDEITTIVRSAPLTDTGKIQKINELLTEYAKECDTKEQKKLDVFEKTLDNITKDKDYFDTLEKMSRKLQNRVSEILKILVFNKRNSDHVLLQAINHFKDSKITSASTCEFLNQKEKQAMVNDKGVFRISLYKILLFIHVADGIKSGKLNLKHSYRYLAIQEYLIDKTSWATNRNEMLKMAGLESFANCNTVINELKKVLGEKYHTVNNNFNNNLNPYISINKDNRVHVVTPAIDEKETKHISALLSQMKYVPILQVLSEVNNITNFTNSFIHHSIKYTKTKPSPPVFFASIIGLGCNIGITKMGQISSGVNQNTMTNAVNWYFTLKNLNAANSTIQQFINRLSLPNIFADTENQRHSSSDGRKVGVAVDCLLATYSFKYFGKDKGVSIYTFIDDRQFLFHHNVMSSSEREAAYVIDGLNNQRVEKIDIHSTDSHGYTELIFATTHFLEVSFAPRIKNIGKQKIYAFSTKDTYKKKGYKILPSRTINQKLIIRHWEDILRFMATIKLNKVSASQLFKRLSSYAKDNPLYKAIKEFGRIIKSLFILTYYDDVKLRQRIEKQLNRVELSNKFANAVFYANNSEFKQADPEDQKIAVACKILIQNAIILWNYLYLSEILTNCAGKKEQIELLSLIKEGSVLAWVHINLHGEFDFRKMAANEHNFDMDKILALKVS